MFNIKYNFLVLIQIFLNAINALLLIKVFGVSAQVDAYLLAVSIMSAMQLIQLVFFDQFIVFYINAKSSSIANSRNLYNAVFTMSCILGLISGIILFLLKGLIFKAFVFNIDVFRLEYLNKISMVLFVGLIFMPVISLNSNLLNAETKFSIPYLLNLLPTFCIVITQLTIGVLHLNHIIYLAYGQVFGLLMSSIISTIVISKNIIPFKFALSNSDVKPLVKNSFTTKIGDNIYNILLPMVLNNILVTMSAGTVSCFYYAKKIIDTLREVTIGPSAKILRTNLTNSWVLKDKIEIRKNIRKFLRGSVILMVSGMIFSFLILPIALNLISMGKLSSIDISNINYIFLSLCPWYLIVLIEAPYVIAVFISKKSKVIMIANTLFIFIFLALASVLKKYLGIYAIAAAGFISQVSNYLIYRSYVLKLLSKFEPNELSVN